MPLLWIAVLAWTLAGGPYLYTDIVFFRRLDLLMVQWLSGAAVPLFLWSLPALRRAPVLAVGAGAGAAYGLLWRLVLRTADVRFGFGGRSEDVAVVLAGLVLGVLAAELRWQSGDPRAAR